MDLKFPMALFFRETWFWNINICYQDPKETLLHIAVRKGNLFFVKLITEKPRVRYDIPDQEGVTVEDLIDDKSVPVEIREHLATSLKRKRTCDWFCVNLSLGLLISTCLYSFRNRP